MMTVHTDQADPKCKHSHMTCRVCFQLPLDVYGVDASIDTQIIKNSHIILVHLVDLDNERKPYIGTGKKERGEIFSECCTKSFKWKFLRYVNGLLFGIIKTVLKDPHLGG